MSAVVEQLDRCFTVLARHKDIAASEVTKAALELAASYERFFDLLGDFLRALGISSSLDQEKAQGRPMIEQYLDKFLEQSTAFHKTEPAVQQ